MGFSIPRILVVEETSPAVPASPVPLEVRALAMMMRNCRAMRQVSDHQVASLALNGRPSGLQSVSPLSR